jgi:hypothetical protein
MPTQTTQPTNVFIKIMHNNRPVTHKGIVEGSQLVITQWL